MDYGRKFILYYKLIIVQICADMLLRAYDKLEVSSHDEKETQATPVSGSSFNSRPTAGGGVLAKPGLGRKDRRAGDTGDISNRFFPVFL